MDAELRPVEALLLSTVAGSVDGLSYVLLHVFTSHVTGNTVHVGVDLGQSRLTDAAHAGVAIFCYVLGVVIGAFLRERSEARGEPARVRVLSLCTMLLMLFVVIGSFAGAGRSGVHFYLLAIPAALAMGCQNATPPRIDGRAVRTYLTGTMSAFAEAIVAMALARRPAERTASQHRAVGLLSVWFFYMAGGTLSAVLGRWGTAAGLAPVAGLVLAIALETHRTALIRAA